MKFGAVLRDSAAELPDTEDLFLKYKQLKKSLKRMQSTQQTPHHPPQHSDHINDTAEPRNTKRAKHSTHPPQSTTERPPNNAGNISEDDTEEENDKEIDTAPILLDPELEAEFLRVITVDVMELNDRYIEKEEDNVIKFSQLEDAAEAASTPEARAALYRAFVHLHGELLMLFHWSVLAYTGLVKILKKHRKRTGAPLHAPHLENLLSQPFCSVEVTCDMVRKAEEWVAKLAKDLNVVAPPAVPLPDGLLLRGPSSAAAAADGGDAGTSIVGSAAFMNTRGSAESLTSPEEEKAKVLEAVAAAVAVAEAQEAQETAAAAAAAVANTIPSTNDNANDAVPVVLGNEKSNGTDGKEEERKNTTAAVAAVQESTAVRRIRAALNVWQKLQSNVSTPSTMIAPGVQGALENAVVVLKPTGSLTTSSIA